MTIEVFASVMADCANSSGAGSKKIIETHLKRLTPNARKLVHYMFSPWKVFGVKKYDAPAAYSDTDQISVDDVIALLDALADSQLTGNAARRAVTELLSKLSESSAKQVAKVIEKVARAGFSVDTYNKVWVADQVPTFSVMLASACATEEDFEKRITFPCLADVKLDGERTIAIYRRGQAVKYYSRSGLSATHCDGLFDAELAIMADACGWEEMVVDGERFAHSWNATVNAKKSTNDEARQALVLHVFFAMPLSDWMAQKTSITMEENRQRLVALFSSRAWAKLALPEHRIVNTYQEMVDYCAEVTVPGYDDIEEGYEGLILKQLTSPYVWDRSFAWCKVKNFYDADCAIIGFELGRKGSKYETVVGRLHVIGQLEDGSVIKCGVGSGLTDELRADLIANWDNYFQKTIVVKYQSVSDIKGRPYKSLRFGTLSRFRDDKIINVEELEALC